MAKTIGSAAAAAYLEVERVERQPAGRGGHVEVQHGEPERLHPGHHLQQLPRPPPRHHAEAGVRVHHHAHLHVRHRGGRGPARLLRAGAALLPRRRVAPRVLRVPEEPRERGPLRRRRLPGHARGAVGRGRGIAMRRSRRAAFRRRAAALLLQRQLLRLQGLQLLLELLDEIDGAADDGRLVALRID